MWELGNKILILSVQKVSSAHKWYGKEEEGKGSKRRKKEKKKKEKTRTRQGFLAMIEVPYIYIHYLYSGARGSEKK